MKLKKIIAAVAAAAVAVSAMAINAFAFDVNKTDEGIYTVIAKGEKGWTAATGKSITEVYGVTFHVEFDSEAIESGTWMGGAIGVNSKSTNWKTEEWATSDKPIVADVENGTITYLSDKAPFTEADEWAWFVLQPYDGVKMTVKSADILGKDGKALSEEAGAAPAETEAAPAETEAAPAETEAAPAEADAEEEVEAAPAEEEAPAETTAAPAETAAAPAAEAETTTPATGNTAAATVAAVMAIAGAVAIAAKKKN